MKKKSMFGFALTEGKLTKAVIRERIAHIESWLDAGKYKGKMIFKAQKMAAAYRWQLAQPAKVKAKPKAAKRRKAKSAEARAAA